MIWKEHHNKFHSTDDQMYMSCNECEKLRDDEAEFMEKCIDDFEKRLNETEIPKKKLPNIESTIDADLDSILLEEELFEGKRTKRFRYVFSSSYLFA